MGILNTRLWRGRSRIACKEEVTDSDGEVLVIPASSGEYSRYQGGHRHVVATDVPDLSIDRVPGARSVPVFGGVRVVDISVLTDCIRANTNATTIMIAERIALDSTTNQDIQSLPGIQPIHTGGENVRFRKRH